MDEINVRVFPNHAVKASSLLRPTFTNANANAIASESMTRIGMYVCMYVCMLFPRLFWKLMDIRDDI